MKYKFIPMPTITEEQETRPLYRKDNDIFIIGWEVGHYEGEEADKTWVKDYEAMTLTEEQEAQWQWDREHKVPEWKEIVKAQLTYSTMMNNTI